MEESKLLSELCSVAGLSSGGLHMGQVSDVDVASGWSQVTRVNAHACEIQLGRHGSGKPAAAEGRTNSLHVRIFQSTRGFLETKVDIRSLSWNGGAETGTTSEPAARVRLFASQSMWCKSAMLRAWTLCSPRTTKQPPPGQAASRVLSREYSMANQR